MSKLSKSAKIIPVEKLNASDEEWVLNDSKAVVIESH